MHINNRELTTMLALVDELTINPSKNTLFDLSFLGLLQIEGTRARDFLQGQISCDVREVNSTTIRQGAFCNLKGRILMLVDVMEWQGLHLLLPSDLIQRTIRLLEKPAALSRVSIQQKPLVSVFGFQRNNAHDITPFDLDLPSEQFGFKAFDEGCCYHLGHECYVFIVQATHKDTLMKPFIEARQFRGSLAWHNLQIKQNHVSIYPQSSGLFLPHRLNLHQTGHISFNKGCYKGQEIIARTHYRATLKHTMKQFKIQTTSPLQAGYKLYSATGETEIGEIIDYCPENEHEFIVSVSIVFDSPPTCRIENDPSVYVLHPIH